MQTMTIDFSNIDKHITNILVAGVERVSPDGFNRFLLSGSHLKIDLNCDLKCIQETIIMPIENFGHLSFSHFFFESVLMIHYFQSMRDSDHAITAYITSKRKFKELLLKHTLIPFTYDLEENDKLLFCRFQFSLNTNSDEFHFSRAIENFTRTIKVRKDKSLRALFLPRQVKENFNANDREIQYDGIEDLIKIIGVVFHSDDSNSFEEQVNLLSESRLLIVPDGSAYLVNGFFCKGTTILVLGSDIVPNQCRLYSKMEILNRYIQSVNNVIFITPQDNRFSSQQIIPFLDGTYKFD